MARNVQLRQLAVRLDAASSGLCRRRALFQDVSRIWRTKVRDTKTHRVFDHDDFSVPNRLAVHEQVDIFTGGTRELGRASSN